MPRQPRNPGSGKSPKNTPAHGPGLYGPAKGADNRGEKRTKPPAMPSDRPRDAETGQFLLSPKGEAAELVAQEALGGLVTIMRTTAFEGTRKDAQVAVMDRIWGKPKQAVEASGKDGAPLFPSLAVSITRDGS